MSKAQLPALADMTIDKVPLILKKIDASIKKINAAISDKTGPEIKTKGSLSGFGDITKLKVDEILKAITSVKARAEFYKKEVKERKLSITKYPWKSDGFTATQWLKDLEIQLKAAVHAEEIEEYKAKLTKLKQTKQKLSEFVDKEQKLKMTMESIFEDLAE